MLLLKKIKKSKLQIYHKALSILYLNYFLINFTVKLF
jgi:hypothetical protein